MFVDGEDGFGGDGGPELTDKGGPIVAGFGAVGGDGIRGGPIAVRAEVDVGRGGRRVFGGENQKAKDATPLILHAKADFAERGKGFANLS